jgi:DNA-binding IclR family transcriptional regulator
MPRKTLQTVERAFKLLSLFTPSRQALSVKRATELLGLPPSTTHRLLYTLRHIGVLEQNPHTAEYSLTLKLWEIGSLALHHLAIRDVARPFIERLCQDTSETIFLAALDGTELVYLDRVDGDQDLRVFSRVGRRLSPHCVSSGLAILAFSPSSVVDAVIQKGLERYTPYTITDPTAFRKNLEEIKLRGYAVNVEGRVLGVSGVAAPILTSDQTPVFAISVSGPSARLTRDRHPELGEQVCQTARNIAGQLAGPISADCAVFSASVLSL